MTPLSEIIYLQVWTWPWAAKVLMLCFAFHLTSDVYCCYNTSTRVLYFPKCLEKKKEENQEIVEGEGDFAERGDFLSWESECLEWSWVLGSSSGSLSRLSSISFPSRSLTGQFEFLDYYLNSLHGNKKVNTLSVEPLSWRNKRNYKDLLRT